MSAACHTPQSLSRLTDDGASALRLLRGEWYHQGCSPHKSGASVMGEEQIHGGMGFGLSLWGTVGKITG